MRILSVALTNFKTHRDRVFTFQPGTNAICGENGAGKTSILEAIAWVLFNYLGNYAKTDFIHNGVSSAQVSVSFISSRDHRTYHVQRCTTKGYTIFDPQLDRRLPYSRIEDEILPWLRDHLGVAPGTNLAQLFGNTIGVPQGTFTADFLRNPSDRKKVFDTVLKVEEYQKVYKDMNALRRYAEAQSEQLEERLAQYATQLQQWEPLQARCHALEAEIQQQTATLSTLEQTLAALATERSQGEALLADWQQRQTTLQTLVVQIQSQTQHQERLQQALATAQAAAAICTAMRPSYDQYQQVEQTLVGLTQRRTAQQKLLKQHTQLAASLTDRQTALTRLTLQLESLAQLEQELAALAPAIAQQQALEQQRQALQIEIQACQPLEASLTSLTQQIAQWTEDEATLVAQITALEELQAALEAAPDVEQQRDRLQAQLHRIEAATQFQAELQQLMAIGTADRDRYQTEVTQALATLQTWQAHLPAAAIAAVRTAIDRGSELNAALLAGIQSILTDLSGQVSVPALRQALQAVQATLKQRQQQQAQVATLAERRSQLTTLQTRRATAIAQQQSLLTQLAPMATYRAQLVALDEAWQALQNPAQRAQVLTQQLQTRATVQAQYEAVVQSQATIAQQFDDLTQQLTAFEGLEEEITAATEQRQALQADYHRYVQQEQVAQQVPDLEQELAQAIAQGQNLQTHQHQLEEEFAQLTTLVNRDAIAALEQRYSSIQSQADQIRGGLPQQQRLQAELAQQMAALTAIAQQRDETQHQLKTRERTRRFINMARKIYKEAGPRITQLYVHTISREADRLFRELMNRPNLSLAWTNEYDIIVQEGPNSRRFVNLSGGEQMAAALAVRLALLKVLADIDIAFFDEPTTNMDQQRRDSLAEAIARIKSFQQLFVISHDDTFEKVTENVIVVDRAV